MTRIYLYSKKKKPEKIRADAYDIATDDGYCAGHTVYVEDPDVWYSPVLDPDGNNIAYTEYKQPLGFDLGQSKRAYEEE